MNSDSYTPKEYWDERLSGDFSLRGTGHIAYSEGYNGWLYRRKAQVLDRALAGISPGTALDIGSGTGWAVARLKDRGFSVEGCDLSPTSVSRLSARFPDVGFFELAIGRQRAPRESGSFALITALDVLYHVTSEPEWRAALTEVGRLLAPGGRAIVTDGFGPTSHSPARHVRFRSATAWREALAEAGLAIDRLLPLYAWLSRDRHEQRLPRLPGRIRGPIELALENLAPREPHLRCALIKPLPR